MVSSACATATCVSRTCINVRIILLNRNVLIYYLASANSQVCQPSVIPFCLHVAVASFLVVCIVEVFDDVAAELIFSQWQVYTFLHDTKIKIDINKFSSYHSKIHVLSVVALGLELIVSTFSHISRAVSLLWYLSELTVSILVVVVVEQLFVVAIPVHLQL